MPGSNHSLQSTGVYTVPMVEHTSTPGFITTVSPPTIYPRSHDLSAIPPRLEIPQDRLELRGKRAGPVAGAAYVRFLAEQQRGYGFLAGNAYRRNFARLFNRDSLPTLGECGSNIYVHIKWKGYPHCVRQIKTHDWSKLRKPVTTAMLVHAAGTFLHAFIEEMKDKTIEPGCEDWKVGSEHLNLDNIYIVGLRPATRASWQMELSCNPVG